MLNNTPLFPPQELAAKRAAVLKRCPILGTRGSGKTRTVLTAFELADPNWMENTKKQPVVIICRVNAMPTWIRQLGLWLNVPPHEIGIAQGKTPEKRAKIWHARGKYRFIITTPNSFVNDFERNIIPKNLNCFIDEYHHWLRNRTKTWEVLCRALIHSEIIYPTSGTPMWRGPEDMYPIFHLCNRGVFNSYWRYVQTWCIIVEGEFGKEIIGPKNIEQFKEYAYGSYCAYMPKKETDKYLPKKQREFIPIEASPFQRKQIDHLYEQAYYELEHGGIDLVPNRMVQILRERQLLTCPKLLNNTWEYGTGFEALYEELSDLDTKRPVIFTDFADAVPLLVEYLESKFKNRTVRGLRGGIKVDELMASVNAHNQSDNDIVVVSQQFAESFEFPRSETSYTLGFNWSAPVCEQAEDRLRRAISESNNIKCFYFQYVDTIEGDVLARLRGKDSNVQSVTPDDIKYMIKQRIS